MECVGVVLGMLVEDVAVDLLEPRSATTVETAAFPGLAFQCENAAATAAAM